MVCKKSKIVCSVKVSRLEFVSLPIAEQLQPHFYNWHVWITKLDKVPRTVLLNVPEFLSSYFCVYCFLGF